MSQPICARCDHPLSAHCKGAESHTDHKEDSRMVETKWRRGTVICQTRHCNNPEERVKQVYSDAEHMRDHLFGVSEIRSMIAARGPHSTAIVGVGETKQEAWADAASRLENK